MRVLFRQGIVYAPTNFVTLFGNSVNISLPAGESVAIHFADGAANYLITESKSVYDAWVGPFAVGIDYWLYWDINTITGEKTYGYTTVMPVEGPTPPQHPQHGQHWFDTSKGSMYTWQSTAARWIRVLRVFATALRSGTTFISTSINSPSYIGTQVGDMSANTAGALVFDDSGNVIKKGDGTFFTTEDVVSTGIGSSLHIKIENAVLQAQAVSPIPRYSVVRFVDFNQVTPATNMLKDPGVYGVVEVDADTGDTVTVITEGIFSTPDWDLPNFNGKVNDLVYVDNTGQLTLIPQPSHIVGIVVNKNTILLNNMIVDAIGLIESAVTIIGPSDGIEVTGITGPKSTSFRMSLVGDLKAVEDISNTGIVRRDGNSIWSAGLIKLSEDVTGVLPVSHGGTGVLSLTGYIKGSGTTPFNAVDHIPGEDVSGDISGKSSNVTGVVDISHGGTGASDRSGAINALLPPQITDSILITNGTDVSWAPRTDGSVTSVGMLSLSNNLTITGGPITSEGTFNIGLRGSLKALDELTATGWLSRNSSGDIITHTVTSPTGSLNITNDLGDMYGDIQLDLPVVNIAGTYVEVDTDAFGRVVHGRQMLNWSRLDQFTMPNNIAGYGITDAYTKNQVNALTWNWSTIQNTPTSLMGYGITDAYTKNESQALMWDWSHITATPTSLDGYGITDSIKNGGGVTSIALGSTINMPAAGTAGRLFINSSTNTLSYDNGAMWMDVGNTGTVNYVNLVSTTSDLLVRGNPITVGGTFELALAGEIGSVSRIASAGLVVRKGPSSWSTASVLGQVGEITVVNGDGIGNIVLGLEKVGAAGTYYSVTTDTEGRVISGSSELSIGWDDINTKPTTLTGYGITDAVPTSMVGVNNGIATLDSYGKIPLAQLPAIAITNTYVVSDLSDMLVLPADTGDVAIRTDLQKSFILTTNEPSVLSNWQEIVSGNVDGGNVTYVNAVSNTDNLVITGGPIVDTGELVFNLAGNLSQLSTLNTSGVVRLSSGVWSTGTINLNNDTSGVLAVSKGGTGATTLTGYVVGSGSGVLTAVNTIPATDIVGNISGKAANVTEVVDIAHGGTGATTRADAINALLPPQTTNGVFVTNGNNASWASTISGDVISGAVALATNALSLGGYNADQFVPLDGTNAVGTWDISISGSAALLDGYGASAFVKVDGSNASGTWAINTSGDAGTVGGYDASAFVKVDGSNASGTWAINTSGVAANVSGVISVANGGTGATTVMDAVANLLMPHTATAGKVLSTNGTTVLWTDINSLTTGAYSIVMSGDFQYPARNTLWFDDAVFDLLDNTSGRTEMRLDYALTAIAEGTWTGEPSITTVGVLNDGVWNADVIDIAYGGTGASTPAEAANNILPAQTDKAGSVLSTDGTNAVWGGVAFSHVTDTPTTLVGYGIQDAVSKSGDTMSGFLVLNDNPVASLHAAPKQYVDSAVAVVTSNIQAQMSERELISNKGSAGGYASLDNNGKVPFSQMNGPISSTQAIGAGLYYEYDTWTDFGNNYDAKNLMISVKVLDTDNTSSTYNMYINSEAVATVAVKDSRYIRVYNDYTSSLSFHISIRP